MRVLVTGAAGFVGCELALRLLARGDEVVGVDNLSPYPDVALKQARLRRLEGRAGFRFIKADLADPAAAAAAFAEAQPQRVAHLAAQAGVRYSLENPAAYVQANLVGFGHVLEECRQRRVAHLLFASSSSVYGANAWLPYSVHQPADHPLSLYAATKKANELMAHSYAHLFGLPATGLRFFTVYGPWGRPDMAPFRFLRAILDGQPVALHGQGHLRRDFTYVDDVVEAAVRALDHVAAPDPHWSAQAPDPGRSSAPYRLYNVGNHRPVEVTRFVDLLEQAAGKPAQRQPVDPAAGDVVSTAADVSDLEHELGYAPRTPIEEGVRRFVAWYREFYCV